MPHIRLTFMGVIPESRVFLPWHDRRLWRHLLGCYLIGPARRLMLWVGLWDFRGSFMFSDGGFAVPFGKHSRCFSSDLSFFRYVTKGY